MPETVGVREIRQRASELIRRAEAGEEILVAVSGRPAARLVPLESPARTWRDVADLAQVWETPADPAWDAERRADRAIDQSVTDPWERGEG
jgi:prevent-host-death family protein